MTNAEKQRRRRYVRRQAQKEKRKNGTKESQRIPRRDGDGD